MKWLKLKLGLAALVAVLAVLTLVLILVPLVFVIAAVYMVLRLAALLLHLAFAPVVWLSRPMSDDALPVRKRYARPEVRVDRKTTGPLTPHRADHSYPATLAVKKP